MSDDEFFDDDDEQQEEEEEEGAVEIENTFYESKDALAEGNYKQAAAGFEEIIKKESGTEWAFKATKKLLYTRLRQATAAAPPLDLSGVRTTFAALLKFTDTKAVSSDKLFKGLVKILDAVGTAATAAAAGNSDDMLQLFQLAIDNTKQDSTQVKLRLRLAEMLQRRGDWPNLQRLIEELTASCMGPDGKEDPKKGALLIDIYGLDVQMALAQNNRKRVKDIVARALEIASSKTNTGIMTNKTAIFIFCRGRLEMELHNWDAALRSFQEAFGFFEESATSRAQQLPCLRYIVLASMLSNSKVDPFSSANTKNLQNHPEIKPMSDLLQSYLARDLKAFEKVLSASRAIITSDALIASFIEDLQKEMRTQVLLDIVKPYTRVSLVFLAKELNIAVKDVEQLLVALVLDDAIDGRVDQVRQLLVLKGVGASDKFRALHKWTQQLSNIHGTVVGRVQ